MTAHQKKVDYIREYLAKSEQLREMMTIQKANFSGQAVDDTYIRQVKALDIEVGQLRAAIDALEIVGELNSNLPVVDDRRSEYNNEQRSNVMLATVQATVAEVGNIKITVREEIREIKDEVRNEIRELKTDATLFQKMVSDSLNAFSNSMTQQITVLRRIVIGLLATVMVFIGILIATGIQNGR